MRLAIIVNLLVMMMNGENSHSNDSIKSEEAIKIKTTPVQSIQKLLTIKQEGIIQKEKQRPHRLTVRTPPSHGDNTGSNPVGVAIL